MQPESSTRVETWNKRNTRLRNMGWGRTSHQISFQLSMQFTFTKRFTNFSYAPQDSNCSGTPVRGNRRNTVVRNDFKPVFLPIQKGELVESASRCGRK